MSSDPPPEWFGHQGIDLRVDAQLALLAELEGAEYQELFGRLRADAELSAKGDGGRTGVGLLRGLGGRESRPSDGTPDLIGNDYFPSPDAELYGAMIVRERPSRIVEVGSGFSTLVARHAIEHAGLACELCVVDPESRIDVEEVADRVVRRRVEESGLPVADAAYREPGRAGGTDHELGRAGGFGQDASDFPPIEPGTLLFIDSSHVVEAGGDGPFLYTYLLPSLPAGVLVHVHDVYIPYDYPAVYVRWGYTEQYALHALLAGNPAFEVVCAPYLLSREHPEAMRKAFGEGVARDHRLEGASFWIRTI